MKRKGKNTPGFTFLRRAVSACPVSDSDIIL